MSEAESILLERFVTHGDSEAFTEIVQQYAGLVYGACHRVLNDTDQAADTTQETFLQLLRNAHRITGSLPGWLHRAATHLAIDRIRKETKRRQRETRYAGNQQREVRHWQDISTSVDESLDLLDEQTRVILIRHYFQAQTTREIGEQMGVSQATISRRIDAGVTQLREKLRLRGIILTAVTLGSMLGEHAVQAAPAVVLKELGKLALVGSQVAATAGTGTAVSAGKASLGSTLVGIKAKVITATAVAALGVGSVATYQHLSHPSPQADTLEYTENESTQAQTPTQNNSNNSQANKNSPVRGLTPWWNDNTGGISPSEEQTLVTEAEVVEMGYAEDIPAYGGFAGGMGGMMLGGGVSQGGLGMGSLPSDVNTHSDEVGSAESARFGVEYRGEPNESNESDEP